MPCFPPGRNLGDIQSVHLFFTYEDFVSIYFLPFAKMMTSDGITSPEPQIASNLKERDMFDYAFSFPEGAELEALRREGFRKTDNGTPWPIARYWHRIRMGYVVFGRYTTTTGKSIADVFLYSVKEMLIHGRYSAPTGEDSELAARIARDIEEKLLENEPLWART